MWQPHAPTNNSPWLPYEPWTPPVPTPIRGNPQRQRLPTIRIHHHSQTYFIFLLRHGYQSNLKILRMQVQSWNWYEEEELWRVEFTDTDSADYDADEIHYAVKLYQRDFAHWIYLHCLVSAHCFMLLTHLKMLIHFLTSKFIWSACMCTSLPFTRF